MQQSKALSPAMNRIGILTLLASLLVSVEARAGLPPEAEAVKKYLLEKEYPELFSDKSYRTRIEDLLVDDIDGDGVNEVVVLFYPHYRQSPTLVFYRLSKALEVTRVVEGLAPGPLRPPSGDYLDSHTLGEAVDIALETDQDNPKARETFLKAALEKFGGVVAYSNFWHVDNRVGGRTFVDMATVSNPPKKQSCEDFEFSKVRQIAFGQTDEQKSKYLAAWVESDVYLYSIAFRPDGLLEKTLEVIPAPENFNGFLPNRGLSFSDGQGGIKTLGRGNNAK